MCKTSPNSTAPVTPELPPYPAVKRVLVCLPLSERAVNLARQAMMLASRLGADLIFAHVGQEVRARRRQLEELFERNELRYDPESLIVERGSAPRVLLEIMEREEADLVIAGALRWESSLGKYNRSIAGRVVRYSKCPTWLISRSLNAEGSLSTAVLSSESAKDSCRFLKWYLPWARRLGLQSLHVVKSGRSDAHLQKSDATVAWACGVKLRFVLQAKRSWCDALWYAEALPADVLCVPLSAAQIRAWDRLLRHGIDPELEHLPKSVLIVPQGFGPETSLLRRMQAA